MQGTAVLSVGQIEEVCEWVESRLRDEHLGRRDLSEMESALGTVRDEARRQVGAAETVHGQSPDVVLAQSAVRAMDEALDWLQIYRRFATLAERRERIDYARWTALGAIRLLKRMPEGAG
jgi:hypothetical protein